MGKFKPNEELQRKILDTHNRLHGRNKTHIEVGRRFGWTPIELENVIQEDLMIYVNEMMDVTDEQVRKMEQLCFMYMTPDRIQDYKNRRDGTFQNDPRMKKIVVGDPVMHDFSQTMGIVMAIRDNDQGYNYLIKWNNREDDSEWYKLEVLEPVKLDI